MLFSVLLLDSRRALDGRIGEIRGIRAEVGETRKDLRAKEKGY